MDLASCLHDPMFAIKIDKIDGEPHPEGVDSFTWDDPKAFPMVQMFAAKQAPAAGASITRDLNTVSKPGSAGEIGNLDQYLFRLGGLSLRGPADGP